MTGALSISIGAAVCGIALAGGSITGAVANEFNRIYSQNCNRKKALSLGYYSTGRQSLYDAFGLRNE